MKAIITVGVSASGKTTFAKTLVEQGWVDINRDWIRFNVVAPGCDWSNYKFTNKREQDVTLIQEEMVMDAFAKEKNIIISDMNLNAKVRNKWIELLESLGYEVEIKDFTITLEEAYKRDTHRANGVGRDVIYAQYQKWLEYKGRKVYEPDKTRPACIIFDVDGSLAEMGNRSPYSWKDVGKDSPRQIIVEMAQSYKNIGYGIVVMSGRDGCCYEETENWLITHGVPYDALLMRETGGIRKDNIIKEELFFDCVAPYWNVMGVVDDRVQVLEMWWEIKVPNIICVGNPFVRF